MYTAVRNATGKRGFVMSRSTYPSAGRYTTHWLGDNDSFWRNLHDSIIGIIEFNWFGMPFVGADMCGFFAEATEELCQRWMQLGSFYTLSRNHNGLNMKDQDPGIFGPHVSHVSKSALEIKYSLLPFLYTQFYRVNTQGGTIIRAMWHVFPKDKRTWSLDTQFMWANALLVAPVLEQGHMHKDAYLPKSRWFDYYTVSCLDFIVVKIICLHFQIEMYCILALARSVLFFSVTHSLTLAFEIRFKNIW
ncbi:MGA-like protein [Mya arenaria]|uniref:MGA-like protein n=1 Tax=Mya arenaria TaxID=6604 RepID=A0ABY7G0L4_MYAAR|nr:MGA-like protein [Mya arenaria]